MPSGLQLFYELVQKLNTTLDLDIVLAQVIEQVNQFLDIDATSISLLDPDSKELVIQMTIGNETDPQLGLRLPPYAGIAGWVVHHVKPLLIPDVQKDPRFYPAVDQRTNFTSRAMICVPLIAKERPIGVIQAISKSEDVFSKADLYFMVTLAEVTALHIENARLYRVEREARTQAEALRRVAEAASSSLSLDQVLPAAMAAIQKVIPFDSMAIAVQHDYPTNLCQCALCAQQPGEEYLSVIAARGFDDPESVLKISLPVSKVPIFQQMVALKQPVDILNTRLDRRYVRWAGTEQVRSWLGVPLVIKGQVIGQISIDRHQVRAFTSQEIGVAVAFAQHIASAVTNARLYGEARSRADDLTILNEVLLAVNTSGDLEHTLDCVLDTISALFELNAAAVLLLDDLAHQLKLCVQRGFEPEVVARLQSVSVRDDLTAHQVVMASKTVVLGTRVDQLSAIDRDSGVCVWIPLLSRAQVVGALVAQNCKPHGFSVQNLSLLEAVGRQIGTTIGQIRRYTALSQSQRCLTEWSIRAGAMLYRANAEGRIEDVCLAAEALTGYDVEALIGCADVWRDLIYPDDRAMVDAMRGQVLAGEPRGECEYRLVRQDGSIREVRELDVPVHDGRVVGWEGLIWLKGVG
ncbi:MAG: GAF domain-containing protein [Anaerolineae bacterium]|nr:GAF domain-containing protein [Anaerolineae bacterium]